MSQAMTQSFTKNAEDFLASRGLSVHQLSSFVGTIKHDETVILGGSVPEGLANADSDVDLLLLGTSELNLEHVMQQEQIEVGLKRTSSGVKIGLEAVRPEHLNILAKRMRDMDLVMREPSKATRVHVLSEGDARILHRIRTGVRLENPTIAEWWRRELLCDSLPSYVAFFEIGRHFSRREDALGELREQRYASAVWMLRETVAFLAGAALASVGETNPYLKWRIRLLEQRRTAIGEGIVDALIQQMATPRVEDVRAYAKEVIQFCDDTLGVVCLNCPQIVPVLGELRKRVKFTTHLD